MRASVRRAILDFVYPERGVEPHVLCAFQDEARESNARTARWIILLMAPLHALTVGACLFLFHETDPARAAWLSGLLAINAVLLPLALLGGAIAWRRRPAALYRLLGDVGGALYLLGGAATSANAQRGNPNVNLFIIAAFFIAFRMRMRTAVYIASLVFGAGLVICAMAYYRSDSLLRTADNTTVVTVSLISTGAFLVSRGMRLRAIQAQHHVRQLNAQLNEKIRERSRELSMALSRLAEESHEIQPGSVLVDRFEIERPVGRGGMGIVYRGHDLLTKEPVAIKVVQAGSARELDALRRFLREVQILTTVTHPAIVRSFHVDVSDEGRLFQVMELADGETLESRLGRAGPLPPLAAARLGSVLADALAAAHKAGVIHLDVKPSNVVLTREAPGLKLLDFGISALRDGAALDSQNGKPEILGTPEFMAPEQVSAARVDDRADIYALGLLLYAAITGRMPFDAVTPPAWIRAHTQHAPLDLREAAPGAPAEVAAIVMSCLEKRPADRHPAVAVAAMLKTLADAAAVPSLVELDLLAATPPRDSHRPTLDAVDSGAACASRNTKPSPEMTPA